MNKVIDYQKEIRGLIKNGVYNQHEIFNRLYPLWNGHYSTLRNMISTIKDKG